jgi:hypothetical protein
MVPLDTEFTMAIEAKVDDVGNQFEVESNVKGDIVAVRWVAPGPSQEQAFNRAGARKEWKPSDAVFDIVLGNLTTAPAAPAGLKGTRDPTGRAFTLIWDSVVLNEDKSPITDLIGYNVYRRNSLAGAPMNSPKAHWKGIVATWNRKCWSANCVPRVVRSSQGNPCNGPYSAISREACAW